VGSLKIAVVSLIEDNFLLALADLLVPWIMLPINPLLSNPLE
jgi:hypothetical protein